MKKTHSMKMLINKKILTNEPGTVITLESDENGIPLDKFWRSRLRDSTIDQCCEISELPVIEPPEVVDLTSAPSSKPRRTP